MADYSTIETSTWILTCPSGWRQGQSESDSTFYFESDDGTKGFYIATWQQDESAESSPESTVAPFRDANARSIGRMDGFSWTKVGENMARFSSHIELTIDHFAEAQRYRIVDKLLSRPPLVVRASFHDYWCEDIGASDQYWRPIIESLRFNDPTD